MLITCAGCQSSVEERQTNYNDDGKMICDACFNQADLDKNMVKGFQSVAGGSFGMGLLSLFVFNPFFLCSIAAISSGLWTIRVFFSQTGNYKIKTKGQVGYLILGILGILVGLLPFLRLILHIIVGMMSSQR